jgi:hypothetical protein
VSKRSIETRSLETRLRRLRIAIAIAVRQAAFPLARWVLLKLAERQAPS